MKSMRCSMQHFHNNARLFTMVVSFQLARLPPFLPSTLCIIVNTNGRKIWGRPGRRLYDKCIEP